MAFYRFTTMPWGDPVYFPVETATGIDLGDLVAITGGNVYPASAETWDTNLATTQTNFTTKFLGVSQQYKKAAVAQVTGNPDKNKIMICTAIRVVYDAAAGTYTYGTPVGPAKQSGNALENQKVAVVDAITKAVGYSLSAGVNPTTVEVLILSTVVPTAR